MERDRPFLTATVLLLRNVAGLTVGGGGGACVLRNEGEAQVSRETALICHKRTIERPEAGSTPALHIAPAAKVLPTAAPPPP